MPSVHIPQNAPRTNLYASHVRLEGPTAFAGVPWPSIALFQSPVQANHQDSPSGSVFLLEYGDTPQVHTKQLAVLRVPRVVVALRL